MGQDESVIPEISNRHLDNPKRTDIRGPDKKGTGISTTRSQSFFCQALYQERSPTLSAPRRYYPGFFAALFLILLRTAIGWHFLTEGLEKLDPPTGNPFSAEGYLRGATGPMGEWFRSQVPDVYSLQALKRDENGRPEALKARWKEEFKRFADHYDLTDAQRTEAGEALADAESKIDAWFNDLGHSQKVEKYELDVRHVLEVQDSPEALRYQKAKTYDERRELESTRRDLMASIEEISAPMHEIWVKTLTDEQKENYGPVRAEMTNLDWINLTTAWGLTFAGIGLMLGFLTPLAALTGAGLLAMFYLSMPPWPGLPAPPNVEGHYWIVNKNLVELLACLVIASTPNGLWIGLDALLFGGIGQRRRLAEATDPPPGSNPVVIVAEPDRPRGPAETHPSPATATGAKKR